MERAYSRRYVTRPSKKEAVDRARTTSTEEGITVTDEQIEERLRKVIKGQNDNRPQKRGLKRSLNAQHHGEHYSVVCKSTTQRLQVVHKPQSKHLHHSIPPLARQNDHTIRLEMNLGMGAGGTETAKANDKRQHGRSAGVSECYVDDGMRSAFCLVALSCCY